jgi:membrane-associated protease RseP (regulator of RpoE activity)
MRSIPTAIVRNALSRTALFFALAAPCAYVAAVDQSADRASARESADRQKGEIEGANRPIDPRHIAGWQRFCADNPEKGGCETILQRLGNKPVLGVLFAPDAGGGVRIAGVTPDGAAAASGLKSGDRLLRIGGKTIEGNSPEARVENARSMLQALDENTAVKLRYARGDRETEVDIKPRLDSRIMVFAGDGTMMRPDGNVVVRQLGNGVIDVETDRLDVESLDGARFPGMGDAPHVFVFSEDSAPDHAGGFPRIDRRVIRIDCKGDQEECRKQAHEQVRRAPVDGDASGMKGLHDIQTQVFRFDCKPGEACQVQQRLAEAFRWNGLNLASVDASLGRYFGTSAGVLVLSSGPSLGQLQAGDVIQRVDGKTVATPRAVMDALRDKPADSVVAIDYLRDRKAGSTQLKVPEAMVFPAMPPMPPAPPAPPAPPRPPKAGAAPHAPDGTATMTHRRIVMIDKDGQTQTWEDDGNGAMPMPPMPPAPPVPPPPPRVD